LILSLFEMVEQPRQVEHRSRSELILVALPTHLGERVYRPTDADRRMLDEALVDLRQDPDSSRPWAEVRREILYKE
jgi:hypothetical protein